MEKADELTPDETAIMASANEILDSWNESYESERYLEAAEIAVAAIKDISAQAAGAPRSQGRIFYGLRILLNVVRDVANLRILTRNELWLNVPKAVDQAWSLAHDTRRRLAALDCDSIEPEFLAICNARVNEAIGAITDRYGHGIYSSWEMEFDSLTCSLCNADIRNCDHVEGRWYDGELCRCSPEGGRLVASAIVDNPSDPRCRIWPWLIEKSEGIIFRVPIFIIYNEEGDEDGGRVVDETMTFPSVCTTLNIPATKTKYEVFAYRKLKRSELVETVRDCIKRHNMKSPKNCRIRFHTLIGSDHRGKESSASRRGRES